MIRLLFKVLFFVSFFVCCEVSDFDTKKDGSSLCSGNNKRDEFATCEEDQFGLRLSVKVTKSGRGFGIVNYEKEDVDISNWKISTHKKGGHVSEGNVYKLGRSGVIVPSELYMIFIGTPVVQWHAKGRTLFLFDENNEIIDELD